MNISIRRIYKGIGYSSVCVLMISVIGSYFLESIDNLFTKKEVKVQQTDVLGVNEQEKTENTETNEEVIGYIPEGVKEGDYDYEYFKKAVLVVEGYWEPDGYVPVKTLVNNPKYEIKAGDTVKDRWQLSENTSMSLDCGEVSEKDLYPANQLSCKVSLGIYAIPKNVRADITCKVYGGLDRTSSDCTISPIITYYRDDYLEYQYLVLGSFNHGSGDRVSVYQIDIKDNSLNQLFFDFKDTILDSKLVNHPSGFFMSFTSRTKEDFRFVSIYHDPAMYAMLSSYNEWKITNGRLLLDRNIVSVPEGTLSN